MAADLFINPDGANCQAQAVRAYLTVCDGLECSYEGGRYLAQPMISRWENCREQGYVIWMRSRDYKQQINIAFFEHRNSDGICAIEWQQITINAPTIDTAEFGDVYRNKYDVSHQTQYGEASKTADWILERLAAFWRESSS